MKGTFTPQLSVARFYNIHFEIHLKIKYLKKLKLIEMLNSYKT